MNPDYSCARLKAYMEQVRSHMAGDIPYIARENKHNLIIDVLNKLGYTTLTAESMKAGMAIDRDHRRILEDKEAWPEVADVPELEEYVKEKLGYKTPQVEIKSQNVANHLHDPKTAGGGNFEQNTNIPPATQQTYNSTRARKIMEQAQKGEWPEELDVSRRDETIQLTQELF